MSEYVYLRGAEEVSRAASSMSSSADTMRQAASSIHESIDFNLRQQLQLLDEIFDRHVTRLEELVARDEAVIDRMEKLVRDERQEHSGS